MIETFEFCDRNSCLHYGCKDILIKDVRIVLQTKDIIIYVTDYRLSIIYRRLISKGLAVSPPSARGSRRQRTS